jgi:hypothetical protein
MTDPHDLCALCGEDTSSGEWIVLNRWIVGTGSGRAMVEAVNDDGEYLWEMRCEGSAEDECATGRVLHWPTCAVQWIDGKIAETRVELRR